MSEQNAPKEIEVPDPPGTGEAVALLEALRSEGSTPTRILMRQVSPQLFAVQITVPDDDVPISFDARLSELSDPDGVI